jgi:hypothetical protein
MLAAMPLDWWPLIEQHLADRYQPPVLIELRRFCGKTRGPLIAANPCLYLNSYTHLKGGQHVRIRVR